MPASSELFWPQFGQNLLILSTQYAENTQHVFSSCQQLAKQLTAMAVLWPALLPASLALASFVENNSINRLIKQLSLLLIWQRHKNWQPQQSQALLCSALYIGLYRLRHNLPAEALKLSDIQAELQPIPQSAPVILLLKGCQPTTVNRPWKMALISRYLQLSMKVAAKIHPEHQPPITMEQCLSTFIHHTTDETELSLLHQLGNYGRAVYLTARTATDAQQQAFFLTGLVTGNQCQAYRYNHQTISETAEWLELTTLQLQPPQPALPESLLRKLPDDLLPQLNQQNPLVSILRNKTPLPHTLSEQLQYLQEHPELSTVITGYARKLNRQQQAVNGIKHAVSLIGQDALPAIIAEARLFQACQQLAQPHNTWLIQLISCLHQALLQLHSQSSFSDKTESAPAGLKVIAWCLASPLWLNTALSSSASVSAAGQLQIARHCIHQLWQSTAYPEQAKALLLYHGYPDWAHAVTLFRQANTRYPLDSQIAAIIHCAWYSACQSLFAIGLTGPELSRQLQALGYTSTSPASWLYQILVETHAYCPTAPEM